MTVRAETRAADRADTGRRVGLNAELIVEEALKIIDEEGLDQLTMRRLANRLDVTPMALYNHVADRDSLERLVVNRIAEEMTPPDGSEDPLQVLEAVAEAIRSAYLGHPNAMPLIQATEVTSTSLLAPIDRALRALRERGHPVEEAVMVWTGLIALVNGHVAYQLQGHFTDPSNGEQIPNHLEDLHLAVSASPIDYDTAFNRSLNTFLRGTAVQ